MEGLDGQATGARNSRGVASGDPFGGSTGAGTGPEWLVLEHLPDGCEDLEGERRVVATVAPSEVTQMALHRFPRRIEVAI